MSELSSRHCSFLLAVGAAASVMTLSAVQYFWAIDWAQFLKAASFEVVAKLVEFVQSSCAEVPLRISDWMDSAHCCSLTPRHCASAVAGFNQSAARVIREAAGIGAKVFINSVLRVILLVFPNVELNPDSFIPWMGEFAIVIACKRRLQWWNCLQLLFNAVFSARVVIAERCFNSVALQHCCAVCCCLSRTARSSYTDSRRHWWVPSIAVGVNHVFFPLLEALACLMNVPDPLHDGPPKTD